MSTSPTPIPRFGRQWEIMVRTPSAWITLSKNPTDDGSEPLRISFEIEKFINYAFWYGNISVYNLDADKQQTLLTEAMEVVVNAGYKQPYGEIFRGRVMQPMWERENVLDFKTTLRCVVGLEEINESMLVLNQHAFSSQDNLVRQMAASAITPTVWQPNGQRAPASWTVDVDPSLQHTKLERGVVMFGSPYKYYSQIARDNFMQFWFDSNNKMHIQDITKNPESTPIVYTPQTGIVGTPQQTQEGVSFRVFLDPRLEVKWPAKQVKLDNTSIVQLKRSVGNLPAILDKNNQYIVAGVRHIGDSRGNEWYTEITGVTPNYGKVNLLSGLFDTPSTDVDINHK